MAPSSGWAFDDLASDLENGRQPRATCAGEEMAFHHMLQVGAAMVEDGWGVSTDELESMPEHPDDFDWSMASELFLQDLDILDLFDPRMDGVEDPENALNRSSGMGDYRPAAWFIPFQNAEPRDGRRRFRR
jgi:hypothetical protein